LVAIGFATPEIHAMNYYVAIQNGAGAVGSNDQNTNTAVNAFLPNPSTAELPQITVSAADSVTGPYGFASYNGSASLSGLNVSVTAIALAPPSDSNPQLQQSIAYTGLAVNSYDTFTVLGNGTPGVDQVQYQVNYTFQNVVTGLNNLNNNSPDLGASLTILRNSSNPIASAGFTIDPSYPPSPQHLNQTLNFGAPIGSTFSIYSFLRAATYLGGSLDPNGCGNAPCMFGSQTAQGTTSFTLDVLTAGGGYTSASGINYVAPVPLPAALPLFLTGFGALILNRQWRTLKKG
jgi:hypothetical protein